MAGHPWFDFLGLDAKYYDEWAQRILREGLQGDEPYFMGPLYPHLLAAVYAVFGRSLDAVRAIQVVLSAGTVGVLHLLGRAWGGPRLAMFCSGVAALYGPLIYYSVSLLYPTVTVLLAAVLLLALHESARRRSLGLAALAGVVLGVYALGRGNILLFAPLAFFWLVAAWGRPFTPRPSAWREGLPAGLVLTGATLAAILPATVHNLRAGDPALLTTNGGLNFYIGNGPMATGGHQTPVLRLERPDGTVETITADLHQDVECRTEAEYAVGRPLSYTEVSSFWFDETMRFIRANPGTFLSRLVMKAVHFWSTYEIPQIEHFGYFRRYSLPLRGPVLGFGLVGPLAVVGMGLALRRPGKWALPLLYVVAYSTSIVLFFVLARYRLPVLPALLPFSGVAALATVDAVRGRRFLPAGGIVGAAVVLGWAMQANFYGVDESKGIAQILYRHGIVADSNGEWEQAIGHYRSALELKPDYDKCHLNLGVDLARTGRAAEAEEHLRRAQEINPEYYRAPFNLGLLLEEQGRFDEARAAYARAIELEPRHLLARTALAEMELLANDLDGAREQLRAVREYDGRWESPRNDLARARAARLSAYVEERAALARAGHAECFAASPAVRRAEIERLREDHDAALAVLGEYFRGGGDCAEAYLVLGRILLRREEMPAAQDAFERALAADEGLPGVRLGLGLLAAIRGDAATAIDRLADEARRFPDSAEACLELGLVYERLRGDRAEAEKWYDRYLERGGDPQLLAGRRAFAPAPGREGS
jgi:tetratricopeptide (TPR) repeat protein